MTYDSEVLADTPKVYYKLDETSGNLTDSSGNALTATAGAGLTYAKPGLITDGGKSVAGSGTTYIGRLTAGFTWASGAGWTLEAWMRMPSSTVKGGIVKIGGNGNGFTIGVGNGRLDQLGNLLTVGANGFNWFSTGVTVSAGIHHLVLTVTNSLSWIVYLDGSQVYTHAAAGSAPTAQIHVGNEEDLNYASSTIDVDAVAVYNSILSATRISTHYSVGSSVPTSAVSLTVPLPALATALAGPAATWNEIITASADTSNAGYGRSRGGIGTVEMVYPVAAVPPNVSLGDRYDKVATFPNPTMDNGRPT